MTKVTFAEISEYSMAFSSPSNRMVFLCHGALTMTRAYFFPLGAGWASQKTYKRLESFHRIDSFAFYDYLIGDKYLFCKETVKYPLFRGNIVYYVGERMAEIREGESYTNLLLSSVPGIDGLSERLYFHCPHCGRRVRYLYDYYKHYACRKCAKLNYSCQQKSGMDEMRLKMERIRKEAGVYMVV